LISYFTRNLENFYFEKEMKFFKNRNRQCKEKKVVDLNDQENIAQLSKELEGIQGIDGKLTQPIQQAVETLSNYEQNHDLTVDQVRKIYRNLNIDESMSPDEMDQSLKIVSNRVAILKKEFFKASLNKRSFSIIIEKILDHFRTFIAGGIMDAIQAIIENFSCICLMSKGETQYKNVCFKFFGRNKETNEVVVLVLNIHYEQFSIKFKFLDMIKCSRENIHLNFLGALVQTDIP
jgi:hypothetical protein